MKTKTPTNCGSVTSQILRALVLARLLLVFLVLTHLALVLSSSRVWAQHSGLAVLSHEPMAGGADPMASATPRLDLPVVSREPGSLDASFDPTQGNEVPGPGSVENEIWALQEGPAGELTIAGKFLGLNGKLRRHLARVATNGVLDVGFNNSFGPDGPVRVMAMQADGKLIIGGIFTTYDTRPRSSLARLNTDGTLDEGFIADARAGYDKGLVCAVGLQKDGRIIVGGYFSAINGISRTNLARLNTDGTVDLSFAPPPELAVFYGSGGLLRVLPDDKVLIGGYMMGQRRLLQRLNLDGSLDTSFANELVGYWLHQLVVRSDGKMYAAGQFDLTGSGNSTWALVLVNADGTLNRSYQVDLGGATVLAMQAQSDDRLVIAGYFQTVNGAARRGVARLNTDGTLDEAFDPGPLLNADWRQSTIMAMATGAGDRIWLGGQISLANGDSTALVRLQADGQLDEEYAAQSGMKTIVGGAVQVTAMALQPDGRIFIGGGFDSFNAAPRAKLARLLPDGRLDDSFEAKWGEGFFVKGLVLQRDGKLVVAGSGSFVAPDGRSYAGLTRLMADGQVDPGFTNHWKEWSMRIHCLALQPDGKILVGGEFEGGLARFNSDGTIDAAFHPPLLPAYDGDAVYALAVQLDGRIIVGGTAAIGLFRLQPDGSLDSSFSAGVGGGNSVTAMLLQPDGRVLVGVRGGWNDGTERPYGTLVRLNPDGGLDTGFAITLEEAPMALALQSDGSILAPDGGWFRAPYIRLHRLNPDGSTDTGFLARIDQDVGFGEVSTLLVQPDGQILAGGQFTSVNGIPADGLARLNGNQGVAPFVVRDITSTFYRPSGSTYEIMLYASPANGVSVYAVQDQPPAGWSVSAISHGGVFDTVNGLVKFGPFLDNSRRTLSYEVTPVDGATNAQCFSGVASADGLDSPVMGNQCMVPAMPHPADTVLTGWRLAIGEVTAYGAAWRRGEAWPVPPNPIPMDYVTRAGFLWRGGEWYEVTREATNAPLWWVNCAKAAQGESPVDLTQALRPPAPQRDMASVFVPGEPLIIALSVTAGAARAYAVQEQLPSGWTATRISDGGELDTVNGVVRWGPYLDSLSRTLTYQATPPLEAGGLASFSGRGSFDGLSVATAGQGQVSGSCRLVATFDMRDGRVALCLNGQLGMRYWIETSTNLITWEPLVEVTNSIGRLEIKEMVRPGDGQRYYRVRRVDGLPR